MELTHQGELDTRSGFGRGLLEAGQNDPRVLALCADLTGSVKMDGFARQFPERFFQCGIAEANMIGVAAGLTVGGFRPFVGTFANFATGRVFDQIRQSVCYSGKNVKICASHAGLTLGEDGATHQILEDIGLMRMLPHMTVVVPCDHNQTRLATLALARHDGPAYLRFGRPAVPNFTLADDPNFALGKIQVLREGADVSIFACGHLVWPSLLAAEELQEEGLSVAVLNVHTIKPLETTAVVHWLHETGCAVVAEEHQRAGGLGDLIAAVAARHYPVPIEKVAVDDSFGESGTPAQLMSKYGLDQSSIVRAARLARTRKQAR